MHRLVIVALALQAAGCGGAVDPAGSVPAVAAGDGTVVDVLPVSCPDGVLRLGAERVRVHADGLHVSIAELSDQGTTVEFVSPEEPPLLEVGSGGGAHVTGLTVIDTVAPGTVLVRCYPDSGPRHSLGITEDDDVMSVEIVDDGGHWVQPEGLDCDNDMAFMHHPDFGTPPEPPAEPVEPLEQVVGTPDGDGVEIRTYGYPEATTRWGSVIDDGQVVSRSTYVRDGTSWRLVGSIGCA